MCTIKPSFMRMRSDSSYHLPSILPPPSYNVKLTLSIYYFSNPI